MSRLAQDLWERLVTAATWWQAVLVRLAWKWTCGYGKFHFKKPNVDESYWGKKWVQMVDPHVCEHAYSLAQNLDPNSEGRGVLQFKTGLMSVIKQKLAKREGGTIDRSRDIARLLEFYRLYRDRHNVDKLREEELKLRESSVFSGALLLELPSLGSENGRGVGGFLETSLGFGSDSLKKKKRVELLYSQLSLELKASSRAQLYHYS
nr:callose synthase 9 [Ipomoea batatas]